MDMSPMGSRQNHQQPHDGCSRERLCAAAYSTDQQARNALASLTAFPSSKLADR